MWLCLVGRGFDLDDPSLNLTLNRAAEAPQPGQINHLGIEVDDADTVQHMNGRLVSSGLITAPEEDVTCCYAVQDKTWVTDPNGHAWEFFYVKGDADGSGVEAAAAHAPGCC